MLGFSFEAIVWTVYGIIIGLVLGLILFTRTGEPRDYATVKGRVEVLEVVRVFERSFALVRAEDGSGSSFFMTLPIWKNSQTLPLQGDVIEVVRDGLILSIEVRGRAKRVPLSP